MRDEFRYWLFGYKQLNGTPIKSYTTSKCLITSESIFESKATIVKVFDSQRECLVDTLAIPVFWTPHHEKVMDEVCLIHYMIERHLSIFQNSVLHIWSEDHDVCRAIKRGNTNKSLCNVALDIYHMSREYDFKYHVYHTGELAVMSCGGGEVRIEFDDWRVKDEVFEYIVTQFGDPDVDRFADEYNYHVDCYNSRFYDRGADAVDCFSQNWAGVLNWAVPPLYLITKTIKHIRASYL